MLAVAPVKKIDAPAARQHQARRFAAGEEAGVAGHLPDLAEHALGGLQQREIDIGADVEDADLERRGRIGVVQEGGDLLLLARIERARHDLPPAASISATSGASLSPLRRPAKTVKPSAANFLAIAAPMKSPAPITAAVALRSANSVLPRAGALAAATLRAFCATCPGDEIACTIH